MHLLPTQVAMDISTCGQSWEKLSKSLHGHRGRFTYTVRDPNLTWLLVAHALVAHTRRKRGRVS